MKDLTSWIGSMRCGADRTADRTIAGVNGIGKVASEKKWQAGQSLSVCTAISGESEAWTVEPSIDADRSLSPPNA